MAGRTSRRIGCFAVIFLLALTGAVVGVAWLRQQQHLAPFPGEQRCVARVGSTSVVLTRDQAYYTAIIVGTAVRRGLGEPGGTVAMATVYQETGIRNLDYGDRDSRGLFQQRPSQNWGTEAQVKDPWYATDKFFDALVKIKGWETADVNDTAQAVQRSGFPEAYRQHEDNARILSKVFTGAEPAGLSCFDERANAGDPDSFQRELERTYGAIGQRAADKQLTLAGRDGTHGWALATYAVANAGVHGIVSVETDGRTWTADQRTMPKWTEGSPVAPGTVVIRFR